MPSLNVDLNYFDHPKTKRLIGILGDRADIFPLRLWAYAGRFFPQDGILLDHSTAEVEAILGWGRRAGELEEALAKVAFISREGKHLKIHDWKEHEGHLYSYHKRAKLAAKSRWSDPCLKDATSMLEAMPLQGSAVQGSAVQSKAVKKTPSAPKSAAAFWQVMVDHIFNTWSLKKRGAKLVVRKRDWPDLKTATAVQQPWGIMALWDIFLASDNQYARSSGYSIPEFVRQLPSLVDGNWKAAAQRYMDKLVPADVDAIKKLDGLVAVASAGKEISK